MSGCVEFWLLDVVSTFLLEYERRDTLHLSPKPGVFSRANDFRHTASARLCIVAFELAWLGRRYVASDRIYPAILPYIFRPDNVHGAWESLRGFTGLVVCVLLRLPHLNWMAPECAAEVHQMTPYPGRNGGHEHRVNLV